MDEVFPILARIHEVPLEVCKAAYDRLDAKSPGYQVDGLHQMAAEFLSTQKIIEYLWPGMEPEKYKREHFEDLALAFEYGVRLATT